MQCENPPVTALQVLLRFNIRVQVRRGSRFRFQKRCALILVEYVVATVNRLGANNQLSRAVNRIAFQSTPSNVGQQDRPRRAGRARASHVGFPPVLR